MKKYNSFGLRTITGVGLVAIVLTSLLFGYISTTIFFTLVTFFVTIEYGNMTRENTRDTMFNAIIAAGMIIPIITIVKSEIVEPYLFVGLIISLALTFLVIVLALFFRIHMDYKNLGPIILLFYVGIPMASVLHYLVLGDRFEFEILLGIFIFMWGTDTGAYLVGSQIGKHKLLKRISPKKTIEGSIGGGIFMVIIAYVMSIYFIDWSFVTWLVIGLICWVLGTMGDLYVSSIKRIFSIKDTGKWLPGHGGILDRFDSFLVAAPFTLLYLLLFKIISI